MAVMCVSDCEGAMRMQDLESMDFEELWLLHEELTKLLVEKIAAEKTALEKRLAMLSRVGEFSLGESDIPKPAADAGSAAEQAAARAKVPPKFRNTSPPFETWSGRGKRPRWMVKALQSGGHAEDFRIREEAAGGGPHKSSVGKS